VINAYLQNDDVEKAIDTGEKLVDMAPDFALGYNNLASAYFNNDNYEKAIEHVDKAVALGFDVHPELLKRLEPHRKA
jgi:tetratricopeptide (TPR) repeat protein